MADALFAAAFFHVLQRYEEIYMANIAQTVNVLQALILTRGKKFCVTPTYHVFGMFKPHCNGKVIDFSVDCGRKLWPPDTGGQDALSVSVTKLQNGGELFISAVNLDLHDDIIAKIEVVDKNKWEVQEIRRLAGEDIDSRNTFDNPNHVHPITVDVKGLSGDGEFRLMAQSVTTIRMKKIAFGEKTLREISG
jgi:alpha-N-arabinofuranosidase